MKMGEEMNVSHYDLMKPMEGRLITVQPTLDGPPVKARIIRIESNYSVIKIVPESTVD